MAGPDRRPTTLVIDDEPLVRKLVRRALEPALSTVLEAADGEEGLSLLDRGEVAVDLVLTDLVMPRIGGLQVIAVLARYRPELPIIAMTGYINPVLQAAAARFGVRLLPKPFEVGTLIASVEEVLTEVGQGRRVRKTGGTSLVGTSLVGAAQAVSPEGLDRTEA